MQHSNLPPTPTPDVSPSLGGEKEIRPPPAENKETTNTQDGGDHRCPKCEATFSHPLVLSLHQMSEHSGKSVKLSILITGLVTHSMLLAFQGLVRKGLFSANAE